MTGRWVAEPADFCTVFLVGTGFGFVEWDSDGSYYIRHLPLLGLELPAGPLNGRASVPLDKQLLGRAKASEFSEAPA